MEEGGSLHALDVTMQGESMPSWQCRFWNKPMQGEQGKGQHPPPPFLDVNTPDSCATSFCCVFLMCVSCSPMFLLYASSSHYMTLRGAHG
jgi:hypothetical protein